MKKSCNFFLGASALCALSLMGCSGNNDVKEFAASFAESVANNDLEEVRMVYPDAEQADSLSMEEYNLDNIEITNGDADNVYVVNYDDGVSITVRRNDDKKFTVLSSVGLFAYPKALLDFAKSTGAVKGEMEDSELASHMKVVPDMTSWLYGKYCAKRNGAITVVGSTVTHDIEYAFEGGSGYYTLRNNTDQPISGDEYEVVWKYIYIGTGGESHSFETKAGKDIAANNTITLPYSFTGHDYQEISKIKMKEISMDKFMSIYETNGDEYEKYMREVAPDPNASQLGQATLVIEGALGGKYPIKMTIDKGMHSGSYYYVKNGPSNKLMLEVKSFDRKSGKITIEESDKDGKVTGTFEGTLTASTFKGTMTSSSNKTFDFDMSVKEEK